MAELSASAGRVQAALNALGMTGRVRELPASSRTAAEAATALGCHVQQIVKSLIFRGKQSGKPVLVLASGATRVDEKRLAELLKEPIMRADPDFVREATGFAIGGVPPLGHAYPIRTLLDRNLLSQPELWAAAGTPNAVFPLTPEELERVTGAEIVDVSNGL